MLQNIFFSIIAFWLDTNHYWEQAKRENRGKKLALAEAHGNRSSLKPHVLKKETLSSENWLESYL